MDIYNFTIGKLKHWQVIAVLLAAWDAIAVNFAYFFALWIRYDCAYSKISPVYLSIFFQFIPVYTVFCIFVFWRCHLYKSIWRFASYDELLKSILATAITTVFHIAGTILICIYRTTPKRMPISYYVIGPVIQFFLVTSVRFAYRFILLLRKDSHRSENASCRVMLIGAGEAGRQILRDVNHTEKSTDRVVCIIDDNRNKWHRSVDGVPVVGGRDEILHAAEKYQINKIYFAIPTATAQERRDILHICNESGCELMQLPGFYQLTSGEVTVSRMQKVSLEDLLGREPIRTDLSEVYSFINKKRVLVTGGGGSIGSELCRQIAAHEPEKLIILDIYENNAYSIQLELREKYPKLDLEVLIGSVRDSRKMFDLFEEYRPQIVYHAAAHKHVPLMEDSPCESIKNNVLGTYKTAYAAMLHGCERFVLISTDKAVNPTNIMGASKRICEMIIQAFDKKIKSGQVSEIPQLYTHEGIEDIDKDGSGKAFQNIRTEFVAVRFGNVLGSNGSVIPIFSKQIEKGGPVTVTHPDIVRYFMTIPEAVSLVMLAGTYAKGGEIFVLDMGSPVKIDTLARNLIRLSGFKPDVDIKIEYSGLRPGEKLYEEKLMAEEGLRKTENDLIFIGKPLDFDIDVFLGQLKDLMMAAYKNRRDIRIRVQKIVSTYHPEMILPLKPEEDKRES